MQTTSAYFTPAPCVSHAPGKRDATKRILETHSVVSKATWLPAPLAARRLVRLKHVMQVKGDSREHKVDRAIVFVQ
jgi:hypothetical protein